MYGPVLLGTVLIHELGHALAARRVGGHADGILLWPLGGCGASAGGIAVRHCRLLDALCKRAENHCSFVPASPCLQPRVCGP